MKKISFFSKVHRDGKTIAELKNGYSDGKFFYYRTTGGTWFAIHPACGLGVCNENTRKEAAEKANSPQITEKIAEVWARDGEKLSAQFTELIKAAERAAIAS